MYAKAIFWQAITPVHPGTGQDSSSVIDLPVAREAATKFPVIPASSLKGVLRDGRSDEASNRIYGTVENAGELTLTDARLLAFPVRSYAGTFALLTCPLVLRRFLRDQAALGLNLLEAEIPTPGQAEAWLGSQAQIRIQDRVILEDIDLSVGGRADELFGALSRLIFGREEAYFLQRFILVNDDVFAYFSETGMEVIARVKLKDDTKTVQDGGLWYEEAIPAEAIFSCFAIGSDGFSELERGYLQVGGQASVGRGLLRMLGVRP